MKRSFVVQGLVAAGLLALSGCAAAPTAPAEKAAEPVAVSAEQEQAPESADLERRALYSSVLDTAFDRYEAKVDEALSITYRSEAEIRAVRDTLSEAHFDYQLQAALTERGLTAAAMAEFALSDSEFFHAEQRRHWGRLAALQGRLSALSAEPVQLAFADTGR